MNDEHHLTQKQLAARWKLSPRTLEAWRWRGQGPAHLKIGSRCTYRLQDIKAFEVAHLRKGTGDAAVGDEPVLYHSNEEG